MPRRLPPLTSLRAFEAAGRHLSFTKAAEELTVTQAAITTSGRRTVSAPAATTGIDQGWQDSIAGGARRV